MYLLSAASAAQPETRPSANTMLRIFIHTGRILVNRKRELSE
jgi:hypothetical protein